MDRLTIVIETIKNNPRHAWEDLQKFSGLSPQEFRAGLNDGLRSGLIGFKEMEE